MRLHIPQTYSYVVAGILLIAAAIITNFSLGAVLLFVLFFTHALVGAVELGTDGWIQNITGNILSPGQGTALFYLDVAADVQPAILCQLYRKDPQALANWPAARLCNQPHAFGLFLVSGITSFFMAMLALTVYAAGKTFFWPTMLAVASDRFPRTGAIAISIMGGIGMMSAA